MRTETVVSLVLRHGARFLVLGNQQQRLPETEISQASDRFGAARSKLQEIGLDTEDLRDIVRLELESGNLHQERFVVGGQIDGEPERKAQFISPKEIGDLNFSRESAYDLVPMAYFDEYYQKNLDYGSGSRVDVVKILLENSEGRFLAVQKTSQEKVHSGHSYTLYGRMAGKWELPGGTFQGSESLVDATVREAREELGIEVSEPIKVVREEIEEENDVNVWIVLCRDWKGEIELSKEHTDYCFMSPQEYLECEWHQDAGYGYAPAEFLDSYLDER
nr:MAG: NUDIX domain family protein [Candidatus Nanosalinarum sp. J07AB56]